MANFAHHGDSFVMLLRPLNLARVSSFCPHFFAFILFSPASASLRFHASGRSADARFPVLHRPRSYQSWTAPQTIAHQGRLFLLCGSVPLWFETSCLQIEGDNLHPWGYSYTVGFYLNLKSNPRTRSTSHQRRLYRCCTRR